MAALPTGGHPPPADDCRRPAQASARCNSLLLAMEDRLAAGPKVRTFLAELAREFEPLPWERRGAA